MAIYFPPLFCGVNTLLRLINDLTIEYEVAEPITFVKGESCLVVEIIGYTFIIENLPSGNTFRIKNSFINKYFEIINKVEPDTTIDFEYYDNQKGSLVQLVRDFALKNIISFSQGTQFIHFVDITNRGIFHDLLTIEKSERVLRMSDAEFIEYFK